MTAPRAAKARRPEVQAGTAEAAQVLSRQQKSESPWCAGHGGAGPDQTTAGKECDLAAVWPFLARVLLTSRRAEEMGSIGARAGSNRPRRGRGSRDASRQACFIRPPGRGRRSPGAGRRGRRSCRVAWSRRLPAFGPISPTRSLPSPVRRRLPPPRSGHAREPACENIPARRTAATGGADGLHGRHTEPTSASRGRLWPNCLTAPSLCAREGKKVFIQLTSPPPRHATRAGRVDVGGPPPSPPPPPPPRKRGANSGWKGAIPPEGTERRRVYGGPGRGWWWREGRKVSHFAPRRWRG